MAIPQAGTVIVMAGSTRERQAKLKKSINGGGNMDLIGRLIMFLIWLIPGVCVTLCFAAYTMFGSLSIFCNIYETLFRLWV